MASIVPYEELIAYTKWFTVVRYVASGSVALIILALLYFDIVSSIPALSLGVFFVAYFLLSGVLLVVAVRVIAPRGLLSQQLLFDVVAVMCGVYLTGGVSSPFIFVYLGVILAASVISSWHILVTVLTVLLAHAVLAVGEAIGMIPLTALHQGFTSEAALRFIVFILLAVIISFQGHYFISQIRRKNNEILSLKDQFTFVAVHDLKNPNTAIRWILERCERPAFLKQNPGMQEILPEFKTLNKRMTELVASLLRIAGSESVLTLIEQKKVLLGPLIQEILVEIQSTAEKRRVSICYAPDRNDTAVLADPKYLKEALVNLFDNGIKYNKEEGTLTIDHTEHAGKVIITVSDEGVGISKESMEKLFQPFSRGDAEASHIEGTGIGLYVTQKLVERMGGTLHLDSELNHGTTCALTLRKA